MLHFDNLSDVEVYIRKVYAKATVRRFEYFQIQYVDISATDLSSSQISLLLNRKKTKDKIDVIRRNLSPDDKEKKNELRRISRGTRRIELQTSTDAALCNMARINITTLIINIFSL